MKHLGKLLLLTLVLVMGQAVTATLVSAKTDKVKIDIPAGYRAVSIPAPAEQLLFVKKGDKVDIFVTLISSKDSANNGRVTADLLQNVTVLNVKKAKKGCAKGTLQLLLNPNEAQYAVLSVTQADYIAVGVRAIGDEELKPMEVATFSKLFK